MMCRGLMVLLCLAPLAAQADSREQIQEQIDRLGAEQQQVRQRAIYRLRRIGKPAISSLINALRRTEPTVRSGAAKSLGLMGSVARRAAPALARSLEDPVEGVQQEAMDALRRIGREASVRTSVFSQPERWAESARRRSAGGCRHSSAHSTTPTRMCGSKPARPWPALASRLPRLYRF